MLQGRRVAPSIGAVIRIALMPDDRGRLHEVIAQRFDAMLAAGLVDELAALRRRYPLSPQLPSMRSVGYRQVWAWLRGEFSREEMVVRGQAATRQLAKRQMTWFRNQLNVEWIDTLDFSSMDKLADAVLAAWKKNGPTTVVFD